MYDTYLVMLKVQKNVFSTENNCLLGKKKKKK